ncbi:zinc finger CCCH domain-containing protein 14-like [Bidens hawaiensis]|uniref:zinc finger CCCH domain-containing protein 14-like n=1 Tax=Bidens hawaiensis TaxID=980011 RepID=UPI00404AE94D
MEKKDTGSPVMNTNTNMNANGTEFDTDTNNNNINNNNNNNLFLSAISSHNNDELDQLDFDFSSGELFNPNPNPVPPFSSTSIFPPKFITQSQLSFSSPSDCSFDDDAFSANAISTESRLSQASFILEYQQLYNSYTMCLASLQDCVKEVDVLRQENEALRAANTDLVQRLSLFSKAKHQQQRQNYFSSSNLIGEFSRLGIGASFSESSVSVEKLPSVSPTSVIEPNQFLRHNGERVAMPKSISVRSKGYLKSILPQRQTRQQIANAPLGQSQRVRVPGEKRAAEGMEFDVYNQGMSKTELCNKWQETGTCPYGDNCHFAHGITELRPVIRHPRYKTEVCRMVLAGDVCLYGHRCHFRHALTDEEMLMAVNPR